MPDHPSLQPVRIRLCRTKGWRLTDYNGGLSNGLPAVVVARPSIYGNPFTVTGCREAGYIGTDEEIARRCVGAFRAWLGPFWRNNWDGEESERRRATLLAALPQLRGKNLACWCRRDQPCHADVLLELANG